MSLHVRPLRPFSAPGPRSPVAPLSPQGPFLHRDVFAPAPTPRKQEEEDVEEEEEEEEKSVPAPAPDSPRTPVARKRKSSVIPSASKLERWDKKLGKYPLLGWLEEHTGIRKLYSASALLVAAALLVFRGTGMGIFSICIGFLYPLHMSLKTIENCASLFEQITGENRARHTEEEIADKREEIIDALRKWLVYWVVYGLFTTLESLSDTALSWLPVYHPLKLAFLLWCFLPRFQGSQLVFDILVRPVLIRHESAIEESVETAQQAAIASVGRVSRVVRAKSIQLSQAIQLGGINLLNSASSNFAGAGAGAAPALSPLSLERLRGEQVRAHVASLELRGRGLSEIAENEGQASPAIGASPQAQRKTSATGRQEGEGEVDSAFSAAQRVAAAAQKK